jgi:hypothetical protein
VKRTQRPRRKGEQVIRILTVFAILLAAVPPIAVHFRDQFPRVPPWVVVLAFIPTVVFHGYRLATGSADANRYRSPEKVNGNWPVGAPYRLAVDANCKGRRELCTVVIDAGGISFDHIALGLSGTDVPLRVDFLPTTKIREHRTYIEIGDDGDRIRLHPPFYADRERLLFELAVRWPDAFEFRSDAKPAAAVTGASPPEPATYVPAEPTGLASELAGPMNGANPAPPRKSGLGVGLFAPPPGAADE